MHGIVSCPASSAWLHPILACAPTNELVTVCPLSLPSKKRVQVPSHSYAQNEAQFDIPREFPGFWWLFRMQHISRYGTRLAEER